MTKGNEAVQQKASELRQQRKHRTTTATTTKPVTSADNALPAGDQQGPEPEPPGQEKVAVPLPDDMGELARLLQTHYDRPQLQELIDVLRSYCAA